MSLSALLKSGVPIASAIALAGRASGNAAVEHRVLRARERVNGGASLADALSAENAVTVAAARLTKAGEEAGNTPAMLAHAGSLERDRAERIVRTCVRLLEPVLLLLFAGVVGVIAAALLQAVYSIRPSA
jgi:type II secretory pathway component PulF